MGKTKQKQIDIEKLVELQRCYFSVQDRHAA